MHTNHTGQGAQASGQVKKAKYIQDTTGRWVLRVLGIPSPGEAVLAEGPDGSQSIERVSAVLSTSNTESGPKAIVKAEPIDRRAAAASQAEPSVAKQEPKHVLTDLPEGFAKPKVESSVDLGEPKHHATWTKYAPKLGGPKYFLPRIEGFPEVANGDVIRVETKGGAVKKVVATEVVGQHTWRNEPTTIVMYEGATPIAEEGNERVAARTELEARSAEDGAALYQIAFKPGSGPITIKIVEEGAKGHYDDDLPF